MNGQRIFLAFGILVVAFACRIRLDESNVKADPSGAYEYHCIAFASANFSGAYKGAGEEVFEMWRKPGQSDSELEREVAKKGTDFLKGFDLSANFPTPQLVVKCKKEYDFKIVVTETKF